MNNSQMPRGRRLTARTIAKVAVLFENISTRSVDWMDDAQCKGMDPEGEIFFPSKENFMTSQRTAMLACKRCPVKDTCLAFAMKSNINHGIWGGLTAKQRRALKQRIRRGRYS